jgi:mannosyltransferase OCH1-like enzyme
MFKSSKKKNIPKYDLEKIKKINEIMKYNKLLKPFIFKKNYNSIIPLHLYTCWHTKELPPLMHKNYEKLVSTNPRITFHLYDENDCREFIKNNFNDDVLNAYDSLIPCSYKSDLWRFCILYKMGGIYLDIKYECSNGFKFLDLTEQEYFVRDYGNKNVYTALIVALPENNILLNCINQIVLNVKNKYYGNNSLEPTGPSLLKNNFTQEQINSMILYHDVITSINKYYIVKNNRIILSVYDEYRNEQSLFQKMSHYSILWNNKQIYK